MTRIHYSFSTYYLSEKTCYFWSSTCLFYYGDFPLTLRSWWRMCGCVWCSG